MHGETGESSRRAFLQQLGALGLVGCSASLAEFPFDGAPRHEGRVEDLEVHFHSVACFTLRWRDTALLTDPFWHHLPFGQVAFGAIAPDEAKIASLSDELAPVRAVVVGHAHYDHCLGLAPAAARIHPDGVIYGSPTLAHTFAPLALPRRIEAIAEAASEGQLVAWRSPPASRLRVLPIRSGHPDNIPGIHLFRRRLVRDRDHVPTRAGHYQEGATLAFLVDFLDGEEIAHRVYIQTSSRGLPDGLFPASVRDERRVDLALLGMDCASTFLKGQPNILEVIRPRHTLFCHWGDFFRAKDKTPREIVKVDLPQMREALRAREGELQFSIPGWDRWFRFARHS